MLQRGGRNAWKKLHEFYDMTYNKIRDSEDYPETSQKRSGMSLSRKCVFECRENIGGARLLKRNAKRHRDKDK